LIHLKDGKKNVFSHSINPEKKTFYKFDSYKMTNCEMFRNFKSLLTWDSKLKEKKIIRL